MKKINNFAFFALIVALVAMFSTPAFAQGNQGLAKIKATWVEEIDLGSTIPNESKTVPMDALASQALGTPRVKTASAPTYSGFAFVVFKHKYDGTTLGATFSPQMVLQAEIDIGREFNGWIVTAMFWGSKGVEQPGWRDWNHFSNEFDAGFSVGKNFGGIDFTGTVWVYIVASFAKSEVIDANIRAGKTWKLDEKTKLELFGKLNSLFLTNKEVLVRGGNVSAFGLVLNRGIGKRYNISLLGKHGYDWSGVVGFKKCAHLLIGEAFLSAKFGGMEIGPTLACYGSPNDSKRPADCSVGFKLAKSFSF